VTNFRANVTVASVQVVRCADDADLWRVAVNGQYLVGFYGPDARGQAEQHREELIEMLADGDSSIAAIFPHYNEAPPRPTLRPLVH
jgi:hypothetical protein